MKKRSSVIRRMAAFFILIEIAVMFVVILLIFRYAKNQDLREASAREEAAEQNVAQINTVLSAASQMTQNLAVDSRMNQLAYHSYLNEYERSRIVLGLLSNLNNIKGLNPAVENVRIMFPKDALELSSKTGYNRFQPYQPPAEDEVKLTEFMYYDGTSLRLRIAYPLITTVTGKDPDYACEVTLSSRFLDANLMTFGDSLQAGAAVLLEAQDGTRYVIGPLKDLVPEEALVTEKERIRMGKEQLQIQYHRMENYPILLASWRSTALMSRNMYETILSVAAVVLFTGLLLMFMLRKANHDIGRPLRKLMGAFDQVKSGDLSTHIKHKNADEFSYIYDSFNEMADRNQALIEDIKEQHALRQNAELAQLQAQIDPHFLYNSFNIIKYMADGEEYEQITEFVSSLAEYYRFINKETRQAIPLSAEVRHMETYIYIQQMRFEGRISVDAGRLPVEAEHYLVPKLILQPLVENCYKHGLKNKLEDGVIHISYTLDGDQLKIRIEDNGGEMTEEQLEAVRAGIWDTSDASISHALANTRRRLELAFGDPDLLSVDINQEQGLAVTLCMDLTKKVTEIF